MGHGLFYVKDYKLYMFVYIYKWNLDSGRIGDFGCSRIEYIGSYVQFYNFVDHLLTKYFVILFKNNLMLFNFLIFIDHYSFLSS